MGCGIQRQSDLIYSKEDPTDKIFPKSSPTFINSKVVDFDEMHQRFMNGTMISRILESFENFNTAKCLGYRKKVENSDELEDKYTYFTYDEVKKMSYNYARNVKKLKLISEEKFKEEKGVFKFLGIFSKNCVEYVTSMIGSQLDYVTIVPFYSTLGDIAFDHAFKLANIQTLAVSPEIIPILLKYKSKFKLVLKNIIIFNKTNSIKDEVIEDLKKNNINVYLFTDLIKDLSEEQIKQNELKISEPETIQTICFTSGTTNLPKGAKLSQRSFFAGLVTSFDS